MSLKSAPESFSASWMALPAITSYGSEAPGFWNFTIPTPMTFTLRPMSVSFSPGRWNLEELLEEPEPLRRADLAVDPHQPVHEEEERRRLAPGEGGQVLVLDRHGRVRLRGQALAREGMAAVHPERELRLLHLELHDRAELVAERGRLREPLLERGEDLRRVRRRSRSARRRRARRGRRSRLGRGLELRLVDLRQERELLARHDVAGDLQLAGHEELVRVRLAADHGHPVRVGELER